MHDSSLLPGRTNSPLMRNFSYSLIVALALFAGSRAAADSLPESWVEAPPDREDVQRYSFEPSKYAPLVSIGGDGRLEYRPFSQRGDRLLDWSYCGYMRSEQPIPLAPVVETLEPGSGEITQRGGMAYPMGPSSHVEIQAALDRVARLEPDARGIRGAVLLRRGVYFIEKALVIPSGVVLRGEGDGINGSIIVAQAARSGGNMVELGGGGSISSVGPAVRIADSYVPTGSTRITLEDGSQFAVGDFVGLRKTVNQQWIDDLGMGERLRHIRGGKEGQGKRPWKPESYRTIHYRRIAAVEGDEIEIDVSLPESLASEHGGGEVFKADMQALGQQSGIERLALVSNYDTREDSNSKDADYKNFKNGISISGAAHSWVRNCSVLHVVFAAVQVGGHTRHITVRDTKSLAPVGPVRGGKRYPFVVGDGSLHLFYNCFSEDGRHDFAGGSRTTGPFAFVKCTAVRGGQSEPHHRWGTGYLYDSVTTEDGSLAAINRGDSGSGHGWAAANTLFWNCNAPNIVVFDPETDGENNFAIGYTGTNKASYDIGGIHYANTRAGYWGTPKEGKYFGFALMGNGHIESPDAPVEPGSLFEQQLIDRIGYEAAMSVLAPIAD
jgi:hypothetical protein